MSRLASPNIVATPLAVAIDRLGRYLDAEFTLKAHLNALRGERAEVTEAELAEAYRWRAIARVVLEQATRRLPEQFFAAKGRLVRWSEERGFEVLNHHAKRERYPTAILNPREARRGGYGPRTPTQHYKRGA